MTSTEYIKSLEKKVSEVCHPTADTSQESYADGLQYVSADRLPPRVIANLILPTDSRPFWDVPSRQQIPHPLIMTHHLPALRRKGRPTT